MLISWSIIVELSVSHYSSFILLQVCWSSLIRCIFRAVMSSCWMSLLFIMKLTIHIPGINPTWSQCMIFLYIVEFSLLIFCWGFLIYIHQRHWPQIFYVIFFLFLADCAVLPVGSQFPDRGSNLWPPHWKSGILATELPGNSLFVCCLSDFGIRVMLVLKSR